MKIERETLIQHLHRIMCGTQITEVVLTKAFETYAITPDNLLLVLAPGLPKTRPLFKEPIGLADLPKLAKALGVLAGSANEATHVNIALEKHRLMVDEQQRGLLSLMTAEPRTIATHIEREVADKMVAKGPPEDKKTGIPLTRQLIDGIRETFSLFKAIEIELFMGPSGGKIQVGDTNSDIAEFQSDQLKAKEEYSLHFDAHLVDVLGVIRDYTKAMLYYPSSPSAKPFIMINDVGYRYLLSAKTESEDA